MTNKWLFKISAATAEDIEELNKAFDNEIPFLEAKDYAPFQESFNATIKSLRSKLTDQTFLLQEEVKKINKERAKKEAQEAQEMAKRAIQHNIQQKYNDAKEAIKNLPLYGYKETIQSVEEKIFLLDTEANNIEFKTEIDDKKEALQNALKLRIFDIQQEVKELEEARKKEEEERQQKAEEEAKKREQSKQDHDKYLTETQNDYMLLKNEINLVSNGVLKIDLTDFTTEDGIKAFDLIKNELVESKKRMHLILNRELKR